MFWSDNSWKQTRPAVDENASAEVSGLQTCNSFPFWEFWQFGVFLNTSLLLRQCRFHGRAWTFPTWLRWGKFIPEGHPEFRGAAHTETHSETHSDTVQVSTCRASWPQNLAGGWGGGWWDLISLFWCVFRSYFLFSRIHGYVSLVVESQELDMTSICLSLWLRVFIAHQTLTGSK